MNADLLEIDRAIEIVLEQAHPLEAEVVSVHEADGRYLSEAVTAVIDLPPFTNSAMDGFALRARDTPGRLRVTGESAAGRPFTADVARGEAVMISTGAVLPPGADAVLALENVLPRSAPGTLEVPAVAPRANVRVAGSDARAGTTVLEPGLRLGPAQLGTAISAGHRQVRCGRRPRVAIFTTGDELRPAGVSLAPGQIYDSNGPMLSALLVRAGATVTVIDAVVDTPQAQREAFTAALEHDVVLSTGGVSVGPHDLVRRVGADLGVTELFWRVKMRPGKPLSFGVRDRTLVFGIPGNPVSVLVCFMLYVAPALAAMAGASTPGPAFVPGRLSVAVRQSSERDDLIRVIHDAEGALVPLSGQQSHQISSSARAEGLARIAAGHHQLEAGTVVPYLALP